MCTADLSADHLLQVVVEDRDRGVPPEVRHETDTKEYGHIR